MFLGIVWDQETKDATENVIIDMIRDEINNVSPGAKYIKKPGPNVVNDQFVFQMAYYSEMNTLYLYYELGKKVRSCYNVSEVCMRINRRLDTMFSKFSRMKLHIVGPYGSHDLRLFRDWAEQKIVVGIDTFSYWKCFDGMYRFLDDASTARLLQNGVPILTVEEYMSELVKIDRKYNFNNFDHNEENVKEAFLEVNILFDRFFGKTLKPIKDSDIVVCYYDTYYPELEAISK